MVWQGREEEKEIRYGSKNIERERGRQREREGESEKERGTDRQREREGKQSFVLQFLSFCHQDDPLSMFEAATWAMSFPDLFPWGDGIPFLKRETSLDASELFRYLLLREELEYDEPAPLPRWSLSAPWSFFVFWRQASFSTLPV